MTLFSWRSSPTRRCVRSPPRTACACMVIPSAWSRLSFAHRRPGLFAVTAGVGRVMHIPRCCRGRPKLCCTFVSMAAPPFCYIVVVCAGWFADFTRRVLVARALHFRLRLFSRRGVVTRFCGRSADLSTAQLFRDLFLETSRKSSWDPTPTSCDRRYRYRLLYYYYLYWVSILHICCAFLCFNISSYCILYCYYYYYYRKRSKRRLRRCSVLYYLYCVVTVHLIIIYILCTIIYFIWLNFAPTHRESCPITANFQK
jgi:hypothetical protein